MQSGVQRLEKKEPLNPTGEDVTLSQTNRHLTQKTRIFERLRGEGGLAHEFTGLRKRV